LERAGERVADAIVARSEHSREEHSRRARVDPHEASSRTRKTEEVVRRAGQDLADAVAVEVAEARTAAPKW